MKKHLVVVLLSVFLLGCNTNVINQDLVSNLVQTPQIKDIELKSFSAQEESVVFDVSLYNPNVFPLPISQLNGDFKLNDLSIGSIAATSDETLGAQSTQVVSLPIKLSSSALISSAKSAFSTQKANYNLSGEIETSAGKLPLAKEGSLSVSDVVSALLP